MLLAIALASSLLLCCALLVYVDDYWSEREFILNCELLVPGMSKGEVESSLASIGTYTTSVVSDPKPETTYVYFDDPLARLYINVPVLIYDGDQLVSVGRSTPLGDPGILPDCGE